jgi:MoxR-like ATPase
MSESDKTPNLTTAATECRQFFDRFRKVLGAKLVLPGRFVEESVIGLLTGGHLLFEGHPGLGKRTLAHTMAQLTGLSFANLACTPDMESPDLTGTEQLREDPETQKRTYQFVPGPLFANIAYVEDIHLAPPKSLAVLVDSMRRRQVGHGRSVQDLPAPFAMIATAPPASEDTDWALDENVTDRFSLKLSLDYPNETEEWEIGRRASPVTRDIPDPLISSMELTKLQEATAQIAMPDEVLGYAWALARATRPGNDLAPDFVETWIRLGVSPQGLVALISAAKARALLRGRTSSTRRDVYEVAQPVFKHRLRGNEEARAAGLTVDRLISMLLERISLDGEYRPEQAV